MPTDLARCAVGADERSGAVASADHAAAPGWRTYQSRQHILELQVGRRILDFHGLLSGDVTVDVLDFASGGVKVPSWPLVTKMQNFGFLEF